MKILSMIVFLGFIFFTSGCSFIPTYTEDEVRKIKGYSEYQLAFKDTQLFYKDAQLENKDALINFKDSQLSRCDKE